MKCVTLVLLSLVYIYYSRSVQAQVRHIGGRDVSVTQYPYMAAVSYARIHVGNGAIIDSRWILTTASALYFNEESLYDVQLGADTFKGEGFWYEVLHIHRHPEFVGWNYNIALIHLKGHITYSIKVHPIDLPETDTDYITVNMLSYGQNEHGTQHLREATYTLSASDECVNFLTDPLAKEIIQEQLGYCAFPTPGIAQGQFYSDAGAPMVAYGRLFGLFAFAEHQGGVNDGGVVIRVFKFITWIQETVIKRG